MIDIGNNDCCHNDMTINKGPWCIIMLADIGRRALDQEFSTQVQILIQLLISCLTLESHSNHYKSHYLHL